MSKYTYTCPSCHRLVKISQPQVECPYCGEAPPASAPVATGEDTAPPAPTTRPRPARKSGGHLGAQDS